jgi:hypothetical protein
MTAGADAAPADGTDCACTALAQVTPITSALAGQDFNKRQEAARGLSRQFFMA